MEQLKADCEDIFGEKCSVDTLFADADAALEADKVRQVSAEIYGKIDEMAEAQEGYDIVEMKGMFLWDADAAADPKLLDALTRFYDSAFEVTEDSRKEFFDAERDKRITMLTEMGGNKALLSEKRWGEIFSAIMDNSRMLRYITLFGIQWASDRIATMARILLYNDDLYDEVMRRTRL